MRHSRTLRRDLPTFRNPRWVAVGLLLCVVLAGCRQPVEATAGQPSGQADQPTTTLVSAFRDTDLGCGWEPTGSLDLAYARCYTVDYYEGGFALACTADGGRYLAVPDGAEPPTGLADDVVVLRRPIGDVYLAASDTMCLFEALGALDRITVSGIARDDWHIPAARAAMDDGSIAYGGKYRTPDYELLVAKDVRLAIQSTMINHVPEVREKLVDLGIPVLVELSSYEGEPLGRAEWVKLYGVLLGCEDTAQEVFEAQVSQVSALSEEPTGKTVAFFYLNGNGSPVVRRPGDYVTKMIEQAGGTYAFDALAEAKAGSSSMTLEMEEFYATAKDADVLIYNATIDDSLDSLGDLLQKNELLADFAAVRSGEVWITEQNMYQQMIATGDIIANISAVLHGSDASLTYLRRLT